ncbi:hypothetical protein [Paenibacillus xylanexedens]|uniref:hypothetical protein n=1 Tax=Paenibacillus xylanexedens TaxID=528191 RepID=UPI0011AA20F6|nr:hypothetical protein [Paenibacillus xylanexedens]
MRPLVFDGVGTVVATDLDGKVKYVEDKVSKLTLQLQFDWQGVMGGDSGYAFHYTAGDLQDKVSIEVPRYSPVIADMSQGATTKRSTAMEFDETEQGILGTDGYMIKAPAKYSGTFIEESDEVHLVDADTDERTLLIRAATTPTDQQYTIDATGKIVSSDANKGKEILVRYKWTREGTETAFDGTRRPAPFKLTHRFELLDDKYGKPVPVQVTIFKALGGGTLDVSQERKKANTTTIDLQVMEPGRSADNPEGHAMTIKFGI